MGKREDAEALGYKTVEPDVPPNWKADVLALTGTDPSTLNIAWIHAEDKGYGGEWVDEVWVPNKGSLLFGMPVGLDPAAVAFLERADVQDLDTKKR